MSQKVVLCRPGLSNHAEKHWSNNPSLGIAYLASYLRSKDIDVSIVDFKVLGFDNPVDCAQTLAAIRPDYVGISTFTVDFPFACALAQELKRICTHEPIVVLGGAHVNALPKMALEEARGADYVIAGQAEESLHLLIISNKTGKNKEKIPGLYWRNPDGTIGSSPKDYVHTKLALLPFPAWDLLPRSKAYPVMSERGCPYSCVFCAHNLSRKIRSRPIHHVLQEVQWLLDTHHAQHITFEDETFCLDESRTLELLDGLIAINMPLRCTFGAQTRVDRFSKRIAEKMKAAGFEGVSFGVESGDEHILKAAQKGTSLSQILSATIWAKEAGLHIWLKFIIGLPGETPDTIKRSIRLACRINPHQLSVARIVAYPGSEIYKWAIEGRNGYRLLSRDWTTFDKYLGSSVELETLSASQMKYWQMRMLVETYLRNFRFRELFSLIRSNKSFVTKMLSNLLKKVS